MAYRAVVDFTDLQTGHFYKAGEVYPFSGNADVDRVRILIGSTSQRGALIEEFEPEVKKTSKSTKKKED